MNVVYKVPILLILFNRPKYTSKTVEFLNMIKPEVLYIHIDGPRNQEDQDKIDEVEEMLKDLNSDINVTLKKSDSNLGCGLGPVSAINWFFENEDYGIIFEDDVSKLIKTSYIRFIFTKKDSNNPTTKKNDLKPISLYI